MKYTQHVTGGAIMALALVLGLSLAVTAADAAPPAESAGETTVNHTTPEAPAAEGAATTAPVAAQGLQVIRDPESGELRTATAAEAAAWTRGMEKALSRSADDLVPTYYPDGTIELDLQGRFRNVSVVKKNADGSVTTDCVTTVEGAAAALAPDAPIATGSAAATEEVE